MKKNYIIPESKVRLTKIQSLLLGGSNMRPDGSKRPGNSDGTPIGGPANSFDARKRLFDF